MTRSFGAAVLLPPSLWKALALIYNKSKYFIIMIAFRYWTLGQAGRHCKGSV